MVEKIICGEAQLSFMSEEEQGLTEQFLKEGYVCLPVENRALLDKLRAHVASFVAQQLTVQLPDDDGEFLNNIHQFIASDDLNQTRLSTINMLTNLTWFNQAYFHLAKRTLEALVGNELVMQRGIGLSIQLPNDTSSLLNVHADTWSGDSPFEAVLWVPLVDCYKTKSMYILPPKAAQQLSQRFSELHATTNDDFFSQIEKEAVFIDVPYGYFLLFNQNLPHGNRINGEEETRWTLNRRFKGLFSPYADKKFGEFFEPITMRAATRIGMLYEYPRVDCDE